jgi:hypothetical protein
MKREEKIRVENIAETALEHCIKEKLLSEDDRPLEWKTVGKIIKFFGGKLDTGTETKIAWKTEDSTFVISCKKEPFDYLSALHELGHVFFDLDALKTGVELSCEGVDENDDKAWLFARTMGMPRKPFEKEILKNLKADGTCDIEKVAEEYKVDYFQVLIRGEELNIWE